MGSVNIRGQNSDFEFRFNGQGAVKLVYVSKNKVEGGVDNEWAWRIGNKDMKPKKYDN